MLRLMHFSDPHFSSVTWSPWQFFSKQWIGNLNLLLFRRKQYRTTHLRSLPQLAKKLKVDWVVASGDFTSTARIVEFQKARQLIDSFQSPIVYLPGNHDVYTKHAERKKRYYTYFPSSLLLQTRIETRCLKPGWWWVGLDCATATPWFKANGIFLPEMEEALRTAFQHIPKTDRVIIGNHFPLFPSGRPSHDTLRADILEKLIWEQKNVVLYLHGHDHHPYMIPPKKSHMPLVLNPGCVAYAPGGLFYIIDLQETEKGITCAVQPYSITKDGSWNPEQSHFFNL